MKARETSSTAVLAFVPVIHKGYVDFFAGTPGDILVFDESLIKEYVHLTRDLRVMRTAETLAALKSILPQRNIRSVGPNELSVLEYREIIMPEDEISADLSGKYLKGKNIRIKFVPVFLRWNRLITTAEHEIPKHRKISRADVDRKIIGKASVEAKKSSDWWRQIGCIVLKNKKILLAAHNHHLPTDFHLSTFGDPRSNFDAGKNIELSTAIHSEAKVIAIAAERGMPLKGLTMYVTTFPCPNCARLIGLAGIKKVYYSKGYSLLDAERILDHFGVEVVLVQ